MPMPEVSNQTLMLLRRIGGLVVALAAVVVWLTMGSSDASSGDYKAEIRNAMSGDRVNQASADSAPKQQVVNGWTARDLIAISTRIQAGNTRDDDRMGAELMLLILALGWGLLTTPRPVGNNSRGEAGQPPSIPSEPVPDQGGATTGTAARIGDI
jgi:hypothetical protein